jgi:hypothetical protein
LRVLHAFGKFDGGTQHAKLRQIVGGSDARRAASGGNGHGTGNGEQDGSAKH